jgi:hypothetical protein
VHVPEFKDRTAALVPDAEGSTTLPTFGQTDPVLFTEASALARATREEVARCLTRSGRVDVTDAMDGCDLLLVGSITAASDGKETAEIRLVSCDTRGPVAQLHATFDYAGHGDASRPSTDSVEAAMRPLLAELPDPRQLRKGSGQRTEESR